MSENKPKLKGKSKRGRPPKHGGYTYLTTGEILEHRQYIKKYLTAIREGLIRERGPTEEDLSMAQLILIDRLISLLGVIRLIEEKAKEDGVFRGRDLIPSLKTSYIAYNNTVRLTLEKLGIEQEELARDITPAEQAQIIKAEGKGND